MKGGGGSEKYHSTFETLLSALELLRNNFLKVDVRRLVDGMGATKQLKTPSTFKVFLLFIMETTTTTTTLTTATGTTPFQSADQWRSYLNIFPGETITLLSFTAHEGDVDDKWPSYLYRKRSNSCGNCIPESELPRRSARDWIAIFMIMLIIIFPSKSFKTGSSFMNFDIRSLSRQPLFASYMFLTCNCK